MERHTDNPTDILSSPAYQQQYYESSKVWIEALAERNGLAGELEVLPHDPNTYPFQRLDSVLIPAYQPSEPELAAASKKEIEERVINILVGSASSVIGPDKFERFSQQLQTKAVASSESIVHPGRIIEGVPGSALATLAGRLKAKNQNSALIGFHPNIIALPIYMAGFVDAAKKQSESKARNMNRGGFDLFELTEQISMPINKSLAFAEYHGMPVVEILTKFATISLKVPMTASSRLFGIDKDLRKAINSKGDTEFAEYLQILDAKGKSPLLITDPTGSTAERLHNGEGQLAGLRFRRIPSGAFEQLSQFSFVWPVTMWWEKNPKEAKWYIGFPESLKNTAEASAAIRGLAKETGQLAGVDVYFGRSQESLGEAALHTAVSE